LFVSPLLKPLLIAVSSIIDLISSLKYLILLVLLFSFGFFSDDLEDTVFQSEFVLVKSILLPGIVLNFYVKAVSGNAFFKKRINELEVWILFKFQVSAVLHVFFELRRMSFA